MCVVVRVFLRLPPSQEVIVGTNKYKLPDEADVEVLAIDNSSVRESQVKRLADVRASRDEAAAQAALDAIRKAATMSGTSDGAHPNNLLALSVTAAKARCTLGEISSALESEWGRYAPETAVVQGAYASSFSTADAETEWEETVAAVKAFADTAGRRPRLLVAKMGQDGHDRGAKVIASGFADIGFDVDVGPLFSTPEEVAVQAIDADVHVVGVSSQAAGHKTLVPALIAELRRQGADHIKVVCGGVIPPGDYPFLKDAGVLAVFGPGTRIPSAAREVLAAIDAE